MINAEVRGIFCDLNALENALKPCAEPGLPPGLLVSADATLRGGGRGPAFAHVWRLPPPPAPGLLRAIGVGGRVGLLRALGVGGHVSRGLRGAGAALAPPAGRLTRPPVCPSVAGAKEIDIAATLEHLRDQRPGMVQTKVRGRRGLGRRAAVRGQGAAVTTAPGHPQPRTGGPGDPGRTRGGHSGPRLSRG